MSAPDTLPSWIASLQVGNADEQPSSEPMAQAQFLQRAAYRVLETRAAAEQEKATIEALRDHVCKTAAEVAAQQARLVHINAAVVEDAGFNTTT